ncbi:MAG: hypothetical protein WB643_03800 [Candidatus Bathyarchaeia archaeon]
MSIFEKERGKRSYVYFQLYGGSKRRVKYLGPGDDMSTWRKAERLFLEYLNQRLVEFYTKVPTRFRNEMESGEERRRWQEVQAVAKKLEPEELKIVARFSLAEKGLTPYELERRETAPHTIGAVLNKLKDSGLIERKSETRTQSGRRIVRYTTTPLGTEIALDYLRNASQGQLNEDRIRSMAEGDFDLTPLGSLYRAIQAASVKAKEEASR